MNESRFDPEHSAAIRSMLIQTVDAEPERARRVHLRVALATVLAAIGLTFGGTAVAVAVSGGSLFTVGAPAPVETTSAPAAPTPTPTEVSSPAPTAPVHPLAITGDRILPHDIVTAPGASPTWSVDLPVVGGAPGCAYDTVIDVSDGYALLQQTLIVGDSTPAVCDPTVNRMALTLVDTALGSIVWGREWSWEPTVTDSTAATLLGTSGRVLVWDPADGAGPAEVLDLATGETLGPVTAPEGFGLRNLTATTGGSGDVVYAAPRIDADGQRTTSWSVRRADPLDLGSPRWSYDLAADDVLGFNLPGNSSSVLSVPFKQGEGPWLHDVLDVETGGVMAAGVDRSYLYFDGFTLRVAGFTQNFVPSAVAGIDDAGNEVWAREDATGMTVVRIDPPGWKPAAVGLNDGSEVGLFTPDGRLQLVDGISGETKWVVDATGCVLDPAGFDRSAATLELQPDGVLFDPLRGCAFDHATGAPVDAAGRRGAGPLGSAVDYELFGGWGTGGQNAVDGVLPSSGTATGFDAVTGEQLWTLPIASDERWVLAGGYVVGLSNGRMFGIG